MEVDLEASPLQPPPQCQVPLDEAREHVESVAGEALLADGRGSWEEDWENQENRRLSGELPNPLPSQ